MVPVVVLVTGLLFFAESQASEAAERSTSQGFLSKYVLSGSDASQSSMSDYGNLILPNFKRVNHDHGPDPLSYNNLAEHLPFSTVRDKLVLPPISQVQDSVAFMSAKEGKILARKKDSDLPKIANREEKQAAQKLLADKTNNPISLFAIGIGFIALVTLLVVRIRRGLQPASMLASSGGLGPDMPMNTKSALGDKVMEMKSQVSNVKVNSGRVGWGQLSPQSAQPITHCHARLAGLVAATCAAAAVTFTATTSERPRLRARLRRSQRKQQPEDRDYVRDIYRALRTDDWRAALDAYQAARRAQARLPANCYDAIMNGLATRAEGAQCERVMEDMRSMKVEPTEASRTALVKAHALSGDGDKALEALRGGGNWTPKLRTYAPVLQCLFAGGRVADGLRVWHEMTQQGVRPSGELVVAAVVAITCPRLLASFLGALGDVSLSREQLEAMEASIGAEKATFLPVQNGCLGDLALPGAGLDAKELARVRQGLFEAALREGERDLIELQKFDGFIRDHPWQFTCVVDGPNVAYLNQNYDGGRFRPLQIKSVVDVLEARGHRVLVTLPAKYCEAVVPNHSKGVFSTPLKRAKNADQALEEGEIALLESWRSKGMLYAVPRSCHDDLYWILASTYRKVAVSNDRMRDHWTEVFADEAQYRRWARASVASVAITNAECGAVVESVELSSPPLHEHACIASISSDGAIIAVPPDDDGEWLRVDLMF